MRELIEQKRAEALEELETWKRTERDLQQQHALARGKIAQLTIQVATYDGLLETTAKENHEDDATAAADAAADAGGDGGPAN